MDVIYYPVRDFFINQYRKIPKFPTEIAGIPLVAYGFFAVTTITLAGVTLYETGSDESSTASSSPSTNTSTSTVGGNRQKSRRKHHSANAKKTCRKYKHA
jgi:hypothetical protein